MTTPLGPATHQGLAVPKRLRCIEVVLGSAVVLVLLVLTGIGAVVLHGELVNRRFLRLELGMPADQVIRVMGTPSGVNACTGRETLLDSSERPCAEQYRYRTFGGQWIIGIDSRKRVAFLHQHVSE
jgi:hypothetical protein